MSLTKILAEFNKGDVKDITSKWSKNYTIGFEFEVSKIKHWGDIEPPYQEKLDDFQYAIKYFDKWDEDRFIYDEDITVNNGLELITDDEFRNLDDAIKCLEWFFRDINEMEQWEFNDTTGIHINIGHKKLQGSGTKNFNLIKALLFLDEGTPEEVGIAYKGLEKRITGRHSKPIRKTLLSLAKWLVDGDTVDSYKKQVFEKFEDKLNKRLYKAIENFDRPKDYGFNLDKLIDIKKNNYVEFRYVGGNVSVDIVKQKLLYFCYIVELAVNENYKQDEYYQKLYNFINQ